MDFFFVNGQILKKGEANLSELVLDAPRNISRRIWYGFGGIPLFHENLESIQQQAEALKIDLPEDFTNKRELFRKTKRMLNKNKCYRSGLIHFQLFRHHNKTTTIISNNAFQEFEFPFSEKGLLLTFSRQRKNTANAFNTFPFFSQPLWEAALAELTGTHYQNAIIFNEKNQVCECAGASLFMLKDHVLITPGLSSGCYQDTLRPWIFEAAKKESLRVQESVSVKKEDLPEMDELFLASEQHGIQWILGIKNKRFLHYHSKQIQQRLNHLLEEKVKFREQGGRSQ